MRFPSDTLPYLRGEQYSNGLQIRFDFDDEDFHYQTQIELLCQIVESKKVIHVGCVDHTIDTILHKQKRKKWLHSRLCDAAARCHGIDIQADGIHFIQDTLGFNDTSAADIFSNEFRQIVVDDSWDYLLLPEVLEHLDNPFGFLSKLQQMYRNDFTKIVMTVPNGISHDNWKLAKQSKEAINSDHRFWFTPYTLAKLVTLAGFTFEKILMCRHGSINWRAFRRNRFYRKHPLLRNDILCIASFAETTQI